MKTILFVISPVLLFFVLACESGTNPSVSDEEAIAAEELVKNITRISGDYMMRDLDSAIYFAQLAIDTAEQLQVPNAKGIALFKYGQILHSTGYLDSAIQVINRSIPLFKKPVDKCPSYIMLGLFHAEKNQQAKGLKYCQQAIELALEARTNPEIDDFDKKQIQVYLAGAYNITGILYSTQEQTDLAREYYKKGLEMYRVLGDSIAMGTSYLNIGSVRMDAMDLDYLDSALVFSTEMNDILTVGSVLSNIGVELLNRGQKEEALYYLDSAYTIINQIGAFDQLPHTINALAKCHFALDNLEKAKYWSLKGLEFLKNGSNIRSATETYRILSSIEAKQENWQAAYEYQQLANQQRDSLYSEERANLITNMEGKFQLSLKDKALIKTERDLAVQQVTNNRLIFVVITVFLVLLVIVISFRFRQRLQKQKAAQEFKIQEEKAKRLEDLNRMKSTFLANITHELKTPLTLLLSPLRSMLDGSLKGNQTEYLQLMSKNGTQLENLINQLLNISRLEKNEWPSSKKNIELWSHLRYLTDSFDSYAIQQQIQFEVSIPDGLVHVEVDVQKLEQVILNLLSNAFKYTSAQGAVYFQAYLLKQQLEFTVRDTGRGIAQDAIPNLFDRFFRVEGQREGPQAGSGIGLALVKDLIDWFEGEIKVASVVGEGSTFMATIPLSISQNNEVVDEEIESNISFADKKAENLPVVLVVEDHPDVLKLLSEQLADSYVIEQARNGLEGLQKATELVPDLIITDIMMPQMDGRELCAKLKKQVGTSHIPVVMLTALSQREEKLKGLAVATDHYLTKPFQIKEVKLIIQNLLDMRAKMGEFLKEKGVLAINKTTLPDKEKEFLDQLISTIELNLSQENYTVNQLAKDVGLSRSQLHRKLVALTNQTPSQFMRKLKLQQAKKMLSNTSVTVSEVAFACGFSSLSYFSRCFKEEFGHSPAQTR